MQEQISVIDSQSLPNIPSNAYQEKLTNTEAANYLGISPATLNIWRSKKVLNIPFYKIGARVFYTRYDLDQFIHSKRQTF